jgi:hypothetical protein
MIKRIIDIKIKGIESHIIVIAENKKKPRRHEGHEETRRNLSEPQCSPCLCGKLIK